MKNTNSILLFLFFVFSVLNNFSEAFGSPCSIKFKEVQVPPIKGDNFSDGALRIRNYRRYGLPDEFSIYEKAVIVIDKEDIKEVSINIHDKPGSSEYNQILSIIISNPILISKLKNYTSNHEYGLLLVEICNEIISSVRILDTLEDEINMPISEQDKITIIPKIESVIGNNRIKR